MVLDKFLEAKRKRDLEKINRELEDLKKKGLAFESGGGKRDLPKKREVHYPKSGNKNWYFILGVIIVIIFLTWFFTRWSYSSKLGDIKEELICAEGNLSLKESEVVELEKKIEDLSISEDDLVQDYLDLQELLDGLEENINDLENEKIKLLANITLLNADLTVQKGLTNYYIDCIVDDLNEDLDQCS